MDDLRNLNGQPSAPPPPPVLMEYFTLAAYTSPSCIALPEVTITHFEIKPSTIELLPHFYGRTNEDPYRHLDDFQGVCTTLTDRKSVV